MSAHTGNTSLGTLPHHENGGIVFRLYRNE